MIASAMISLAGTSVHYATTTTHRYRSSHTCFSIFLVWLPFCPISCQTLPCESKRWQAVNDTRRCPVCALFHHGLSFVSSSPAGQQLWSFDGGDPRLSLQRFARARCSRKFAVRQFYRSYRRSHAATDTVFPLEKSRLQRKQNQRQVRKALPRGSAS